MDLNHCGLRLFWYLSNYITYEITKLSLCAYHVLPISDEADRIEITEHPQAEIEARVNETITLKCRAHNTSGKELDYQWFKENNKKGMLVVPFGLSSHLC